MRHLLAPLTKFALRTHYTDLVVIARADVAHFMLRVLQEPQAIGHAVGIAS